MTAVRKQYCGNQKRYDTESVAQMLSMLTSKKASKESISPGVDYCSPPSCGVLLRDILSREFPQRCLTRPLFFKKKTHTHTHKSNNCKWKTRASRMRLLLKNKNKIHTYTHTHAHARIHAYTHTRTHARTYARTQSIQNLSRHASVLLDNHSWISLPNMLRSISYAAIFICFFVLHYESFMVTLLCEGVSKTCSTLVRSKTCVQS